MNNLKGTVERSDAADMLGVTVGAMEMWAKRKIGPKPVRVEMGYPTLYLKADVESFAKIYKKWTPWKYLPTWEDLPAPAPPAPAPKPQQAVELQPVELLTLNDTVARLFRPIYDWVVDMEAKNKNLEREIAAVQHKYQEANDLFNGVVEERNQLKAKLSEIGKVFSGKS